MRKTFKYRIYPTKSQEHLLTATLDECCWLYNHLLEQRKTTWEGSKKSLALYDQIRSLPNLKKERHSLNGVYSQVLQNVATRLDVAFKGFFRRVVAGETPGYPRFRGLNRYDSFTFPQASHGCRLVGDRLYLTRLGSIRVALHRPVEGVMKTVTLCRSRTGKWYVAFSCEWEPTPLPVIESQVGVDVGLTHFATLSDGSKIENPRFFQQEEKALAKVQRRLSKTDKRTKQYKKNKKSVARVHERIAWRRENFAHQESRKIVNNHQVIVVEDLSIKKMASDHRFAKKIMDVSWKQFSDLLCVKAEWAARTFIAVNPAFTSQDCSSCGHRQEMPLNKRLYSCPSCNLTLDRDHNAALNILRLGLQASGIQSTKVPSF